MIGIIFATKREAFPFLKNINAYLYDKHPFLLYKSLKKGMLSFIIIISGIGKVAAATATVQLLIKYNVKFILNVGICGMLKHNIFSYLGEIYRINKAFEGDYKLSFTNEIEMFKCSPFFIGLKNAILITTDNSVFDEGVRNNISDNADLVDMEGAAILRVAKMYGVGCDIIKGTTDFANKIGVRVMKNNLDKVAVSLSKVLFRNIKN